MLHPSLTTESVFVKIGEYVRLDYATEHPLDRVISQQCMNKYNALFFFLLKLKRVNHCLTLIWKQLNGAEFRVSAKTQSKEIANSPSFVTAANLKS